MSIELSHALKRLEEKIYALAGEEFNINSPKQLSVILFEKMGINTFEVLEDPGEKGEDGHPEQDPEDEQPPAALAHRAVRGPPSAGERQVARAKQPEAAHRRSVTRSSRPRNAAAR